MEIWTVPSGRFELWPDLWVDGDDLETRCILARREVVGILVEQAQASGGPGEPPVTVRVRAEDGEILWEEPG
jgi:hypothetical protein